MADKHTDKVEAAAPATDLPDASTAEAKVDATDAAAEGDQKPDEAIKDDAAGVEGTPHPCRDFHAAPLSIVWTFSIRAAENPLVPRIPSVHALSKRRRQHQRQQDYRKHRRERA